MKWGRGVPARVRAALPLLCLLPLAALAGCVEPPEQRYVVQLLGAETVTVEVPLPVDAKGSLPRFMYEIEFLRGAGTFNFVESEKGPAFRVTVFQSGGQDVILSTRQPGAEPLELTLAAGEDAHWMNATGEATVVMVLGHTTPPDCPELRLETTFAGPGWQQVPLARRGNCPE